MTGHICTFNGSLKIKGQFEVMAVSKFMGVCLAFINGAQIWALTYRARRSESNLDYRVGCAIYAPNSKQIHFQFTDCFFTFNLFHSGMYFEMVLTFTFY